MRIIFNNGRPFIPLDDRSNAILIITLLDPVGTDSWDCSAEIL